MGWSSHAAVSAASTLVMAAAFLRAHIAIGRCQRVSLAHGVQIRRLRVERGRALRKSLGQHLLVDRTSLNGILDAAAIMPTEHILEVGPGTGNLTVLLLERAAAVTAVELDDDLYEMLLSRIHRM